MKAARQRDSGDFDLQRGIIPSRFYRSAIPKNDYRNIWWVCSTLGNGAGNGHGVGMA